ncbi:MlaD family protein [Pedobacter gandavensis]|uniref:MlaD family protein n=1 Tax=Pedobacter gandavensis TaxID=2679963 RepID=UPI00247A3CA6|nr:MlaD family protein [Pedobacter gandavensis]WGQ09856.1 MlaD family protein [Pedobacter gandavensis]
MIGKNRSLFGASFVLKARFSNLNGLTKGNNVWYAGIQAGTVKGFKILNDSTIEVSMLIDQDLKPYIRKNAIVSIGTEGLMGNKIMQIMPGSGNLQTVADGDFINAKKGVVIDEMFQTLSVTNANILQISEGLKSSVLRLNESKIWEVLTDREISVKLKSTLSNLNQASIKVNEVAGSVNDMVTLAKQGKGTAGMLLMDTTFASGLNNVLRKLKAVSDNAEELTSQLNRSGLLNGLLKDTVMLKKLDASLTNIEEGTAGFNQNMEALKHNFLFRGYFKKQEKLKQKQLMNPM